MNTTQIKFSTAQVAKLAGCTTDAIQAARRRYGHWRDVVPVVGPDSLLYWPAAEVRAVVAPAWPLPSGTEAFVEWATAVVPEVPVPALQALAVALLGSEATLGWVPTPGQLTGERLETEAQLWAMTGQALADRLDMARSLKQGDVSEATGRWMARVLRDLLRALDEEVAA